MNKKTLAILLIIVILVALFIIYHQYNTNITNPFPINLSKTKVIIVNNLRVENPSKEKRITKKSEVEEIIQIIKNAQEMPEDYKVNYGVIPHYKLKMIDKKDNQITGINIYAYSGDEIYFALEEEENKYYILEDNLLLEKID